jgi:hypothetical protein
VPPGLTPELASCTQTQRQKDPFIYVKLEKAFHRSEISRVHVFNRMDCCGERLHDFEVRIGFEEEIEKNALCATYEGVVPGYEGGAAIVECGRPLKGSVISVQIKGEAEILTVCEIQARPYFVGCPAYGVRRGVSKGVENGCRTPALPAGHP